MKGLLTTAAALLALGALPASAQGPRQPLEGVWATSATSVGRTLVAAAGANTFRGTIVRGSDPTRCHPDATGFVHPFGAPVWQATGGGTAYSGTVAYFDARCRVLGHGAATWTVGQIAGKLSLRLCATPQGGGPTSCTDLVQVAPQRPAPTFATVATMPPAARCANPRAFVVRLDDRSNDPLRAAKVSVNGTVRRTATGAPLTGSLALHRLPRGRLSVRVVLTTATGRKLVGARAYRACPAG